MLHTHKVTSKLKMFFDSVHLVKNIRNNLLSRKEIVFSSFSFNTSAKISINCDGCYNTWTDFNYIFDQDEVLSANLRKAPDLSCKV